MSLNLTAKNIEIAPHKIPFATNGAIKNTSAHPVILAAPAAAAAGRLRARLSRHRGGGGGERLSGRLEPAACR